MLGLSRQLDMGLKDSGQRWNLGSLQCQDGNSKIT